MNALPEVKHTIKESIIRLLYYCKKNNWAGIDPYDGLNSRIFKSLPFVSNRILRLIFIQTMKRSPVNLRPIFLVPKEQNPKGLALFCSALIRLHNLQILDNNNLLLYLLNRLIDLRSQNTPYYCWGYNFDWQSRGYFLPKFFPNIICTTFAGNALLDAHRKYGNMQYFDMAYSAALFIINGLNISNHNDGICFSYTPLDEGQVHNANLLGAAFLSRIYSLTGENNFLDSARRATRFSVAMQNNDGSWPYGEGRSQRWIDNFHTGYNLVALKKYSRFTGDKGYDESIKRGFQFFLKKFFTYNGVPKYYHNKIYPIDIHAVAQSIITLIELNNLDKGASDLAVSVCKWAIRNMQSKNGYFYYQITKHYYNKIPYMRWSQAWMLLALSTILEIGGQNAMSGY